MIPIPLPYALLFAGAAALSGGYAGMSWEKGRHARAEVSRLTNALDAAATNVTTLVKLTEADIARRESLKLATEKITERIIHETLQPIYTDCRITDNSLRDLNELTSTINSTIKGAGSVSGGTAPQQ